MAQKKYEVMYDFKPSAKGDLIKGGRGYVIAMEEEEARVYVEAGTFRPHVETEEREIKDPESSDTPDTQSAPDTADGTSDNDSNGSNGSNDTGDPEKAKTPEATVNNDAVPAEPTEKPTKTPTEILDESRNMQGTGGDEGRKTADVEAPAAKPATRRAQSATKPRSGGKGGK